MNIDQAFNTIHTNLSRILQFAQLGKYSHVLQQEEVHHLQTVLENILALENNFNNATNQEQKEKIYQKLAQYKSFTIRDFLVYTPKV